MVAARSGVRAAGRDPARLTRAQAERALRVAWAAAGVRRNRAPGCGECEAELARAAEAVERSFPARGSRTR
jgi:hypothetical protein